MTAAAALTTEKALRGSRWRVFVVLFSLTCVAIVLDLLTTYLGFRRVGARFEQNGVVLFLIQRIGWAGVGGILLIACLACFRSFRTVYWRLSTRWSLWLNVVLGLACGFRWLVVITDAFWLVR